MSCPLLLSPPHHHAVDRSPLHCSEVHLGEKLLSFLKPLLGCLTLCHTIQYVPYHSQGRCNSRGLILLLSCTSFRAFNFRYSQWTFASNALVLDHSREYCTLLSLYSISHLINGIDIVQSLQDMVDWSWLTFPLVIDTLFLFPLPSQLYTDLKEYLSSTSALARSYKIDLEWSCRRTRNPCDWAHSVYFSHFILSTCSELSPPPLPSSSICRWPFPATLFRSSFRQEITLVPEASPGMFDALSYYTVRSLLPSRSLQLTKTDSIVFWQLVRSSSFRKIRLRFLQHFHCSLSLSWVPHLFLTLIYR